MSDLSNFPLKRRDDSRNMIRELLQSWDDRLDCPPTKLPERYLRKKPALALKMSCELHGAKVGMLALESSKPVGLVRDEFSRIEHNNQLLVLIDNVHVVYDPEKSARRCEALIRLKIADHVADEPAANSPYFSFISGNTAWIAWPNFQDRELDIDSVFFSVDRVREEPDDMIKGRPEMMNNFAT